MLRFVSDHLKTVDMCKNAAKKLSFVIRSVPDWYKSQKMCDKAILETGGTLKSVPDCCKNKKCVIKLMIFILCIKIYFRLL